MVSFRSFFFLCVICVILGAAGSARAAFLFCNQTKTALEAAFGSRDDGIWLSEGWWQIQPGQCARVMNKPLVQRFYFYFARALTLPSKDSKEPKVWGGRFAFCTDNKAFRIEGDSQCEQRGFKRQGFQDVDVGSQQKDYTLTFKDENGR